MPLYFLGGLSVMNLDQNTNATFYQYRLLQRSAFPKPLTWAILILPLLYLAVEIMVWGPFSILSFIVAAPISLWVQFVICRSVIIIISHAYRTRWHFSWGIPWIGYMPNQYIAYSIFKKTHLHYTWIGLAIIAVLFPWLPESLTFSLCFWHLWLLIPRLFAFLALFRQRKDGMLKFSDQEFSYYIQ
jgi:hypothetical protein